MRSPKLFYKEEIKRGINSMVARFKDMLKTGSFSLTETEYYDGEQLTIYDDPPNPKRVAYKVEKTTTFYLDQERKKEIKVLDKFKPRRLAMIEARKR